MTPQRDHVGESLAPLADDLWPEWSDDGLAAAVQTPEGAIEVVLSPDGTTSSVTLGGGKPIAFDERAMRALHMLAASTWVRMVDRAESGG